MKTFTSIFALIFIVSSPLHAAAGTEGASFLEIPVGAEAAAMGDAYSALATNAYAPTYNPAGLGFIHSTQLAGQHLSFLDSIHDEYLSFVHPIHPGSAWGTSAQYLGSGDIAQTTDTGLQTGTFSTHFAAYTFAYGQKVTDQISLGLAAKWINAQISNVSANAYAGDAGIMLQATDKLTLAGVMSNAGSKLTFLDDGGSLPLAGRLGAAYKVTPRWTVSADGVYEAYGQASAHVGMEVRPVPFCSLRAGYRTDTTAKLGAMAGVTAGIGLDVWGQEFSYAWAPLGDLGFTQYFSLMIRFGELQESRKNLIQYHSIKTHMLAQDDLSDLPDPEIRQLLELLDHNDDVHLSQNSSAGEVVR